MKLGFLSRAVKAMRPKRPGWQVGAALLFIAAGFVAIGIAWNGAASIDFAQGQLPYLLSGGATGLGLIGVGVALILFEGQRRDRAHLDQRLDQIARLLEETRSGNGHSPNGMRSIPEGLYVAGEASYHLPSCRLVTGKDDRMLLTSEEAQERGLAPCRVCQPDVEMAERA